MRIQAQIGTFDLPPETFALSYTLRPCGRNAKAGPSHDS